ncbi:thioredoxin domain-containing protein [Fodinicola feengrottensis]|uniref:Thioredoxin domain-containing protein n=1 Tax=Fodinicola feengrottensis TaxID=435914 RepID=A0ABN2G025_9ACTN|nr:hypothetical protein [Fodinicola feengrottensis]
MPVLIAAVVLLGVLCLVGLLLIFAILRRLREQGAELENLRKVLGMGITDYDVTELVGRKIPEIGGRTPALVGFFSVGCDSCHEQAPKFAEQASGQHCVAIVTGTGAERDPLLRQLGDAAVLTGPDGAEVARGLGIRAYPTFLRVDTDGVIVRAQTEAAGLSERISA